MDGDIDSNISINISINMDMNMDMDMDKRGTERMGTHAAIRMRTTTHEHPHHTSHHAAQHALTVNAISAIRVHVSSSTGAAPMRSATCRRSIPTYKHMTCHVTFTHLIASHRIILHHIAAHPSHHIATHPSHHIFSCHMGASHLPAPISTHTHILLHECMCLWM